MTDEQIRVIVHDLDGTMITLRHATDDKLYIALEFTDGHGSAWTTTLSRLEAQELADALRKMTQKEHE